MIIRSQNKHTIVKPERIMASTDAIHRGNSFGGDICEVYYGVFAYVYGKEVRIGKYSTEEKTIKVLDMICEAYQKCEDRKSGLRKIADTDFVFQMPQDSEV